MAASDSENIAQFAEEEEGVNSTSEHSGNEGRNSKEFLKFIVAF